MVHGVLNRFRKIGLWKKIIALYILIIIIPSFFLGLFAYQQFYGVMMNGYVNQKQQIIDDYYFVMEKELSKIQDASSLFQYNTKLIDYLNGEYIADLKDIYLFSKYFKQVYGYVYSSMPFVKNINVYKYNNKVAPVFSWIYDMKALQDAEYIQNKTTPGKGIWICRQGKNGGLPDIRYYERIYDNGFSKELGILEIVPNEIVLTNYLNDINSISGGNDGVYLLNSNNEMLYKKEKNKLFDHNVGRLLMGEKENGNFRATIDGRKYIGNMVYVKELNIKMSVLEKESNAVKYLKFSNATLLLYMCILVLVLSAIYYYITSNITTRIVKLAKHMRKVDETNLSLYMHKSGKDEIGLLIESYNSMIMRIDELVNTVHKEELLRKEAAYAALQAQIRPHFLFGTLETIRMLAESNNDFQVSGIIYTFGRLMRYSLSSSKNEVALSEEIDNIKNYLEIQKMRMGERLQYEFDIQRETDRFLCPRFILQPLVENSIMHGISKCRGVGVIRISIANSQDYVIITIEDNGFGISTEKQLLIQDVLEHKTDIKDFQTETSGFGLFNVSERIKAYFGGNSRLVLSSEPDSGTRCVLYLFVHEGEVKYENNDSR